MEQIFHVVSPSVAAQIVNDVHLRYECAGDCTNITTVTLGKLWCYHNGQDFQRKIFCCYACSLKAMDIGYMNRA